jgi:radical SAM superfamily enzyme YgiQ (UPF0313 family)
MRVDAAERRLLREMKDSGCHTVMFGVESANERVLKLHNKGTTLNQTKEAFLIAQEVGLRTLAHFIIGLKSETFDSQMQLIEFCLSLNPDFASFNIAAPLYNTSFREEAEKNNWLVNKNVEVDSSCSYPIWESEGLKRSEIWRIRKLAIRKYYLRPQYAFSLLRDIRTPYQLYSFFREGLHLSLSLAGKR